MLTDLMMQPADLRLFDSGGAAAPASPDVGGAGQSAAEGAGAAEGPSQSASLTALPEGEARGESGLPQPQPRLRNDGDPGRSEAARLTRRAPDGSDGDVRRMEAAYRAHVFASAQSARWAAEGAALRAREPDFDLDDMRGDPVFALLLTHGVPMEQAWRASTVDERVSRAAAAAEKAVTDHIRIRGARPAEAGSGGAAVCQLRPDVARLSDSEVLGVLERLGRHERVSFG